MTCWAQSASVLLCWCVSLEPRGVALTAVVFLLLQLISDVVVLRSRIIYPGPHCNTGHCGSVAIPVRIGETRVCTAIRCVGKSSR